MGRLRRPLLTVGIGAVCALAFQPVGRAFADEMALVSSANPSVVGQRVTFTVTFPLTCADGASVTFTVDGRSFGPDSYSNPGGTRVQASLSRIFTTPGNHAVGATYTAGVAPDPVCGGSRSLIQRVSARPSPVATRHPATPSPPRSAPGAGTPPAPSPTRASSPTATLPSPTPGGPASVPRTNLEADRIVPAGAALALIALSLVVGLVLALAFLSRRRTP